MKHVVVWYQTQSVLGFRENIQPLFKIILSNLANIGENGRQDRIHARPLTVIVLNPEVRNSPHD